MSKPVAPAPPAAVAACGSVAARALLPTGAVSRLAALAVLLSPVAALAQTITVSTNAFGTNPVNLGLTACNNNQIVVVFWNLNATPNSSDVVKIFITKDTASCSASSDPTTAPTPALLQPTSAKTTDQATVTAQQLLLDLPNGCANTDHKATSPYTVYFCVRRTSGNLLNTGNLQMNFALVAPNPPSAPVATPGDSHLV
ncbi:MAG TPA: hypothetical protein VG496_14885, partial [Myxococcales bacterium]|nr:hypothetical protein [Myxococcales bacterium]